MNNQPTPPPSQPASPAKKSDKSIKAPRRRRRGIINFLLFIGIIAAIGLFAWAETQRRDATRRLKETEQELEKIRQSTERRGTEVAQQVLESVRKLIDIPTDPEPTVATIVDVDALREASPFYNKAENGDHLIITETRAILYDPDRGIILDVVPVKINKEQQQQIPAGQEGAQTSPTGAASQQQQEQPSEQPTEQPQQ